MSDTASANNSLLVSRERSANAIREALRLYAGRGRRYSVKQLSNATGVKDRVIECAMCVQDNADWRPLPIEALLSIGMFLGADFTNEWLGLSQQGAFDFPEDEPSPGELAIEGAQDSATVVRAAMDGKFDGEECADLKVIAARKIKRGQQLLSMARAA